MAALDLAANPEAEQLVEMVRAYNPSSNSDLIREAYRYGERMHAGQLRKSGEPYFTHPVAVAKMLTELQMDDDTIVTALLHDTLEDTQSTRLEIRRKFSKDIETLVDGVTNLTNLELKPSLDKDSANLRKLFLSMAKDLRVLLVKLTDRLHNMRTIKYLDKERRAKKSQETMEIYAPLAGRVGMQAMREELEDLAFQVLNPAQRSSIIRQFLTLRREQGDVIPKITDDIRERLRSAGVEAEVFGREKKPYAIWRKMQAKQEGFSRLSDIFGFRIITGSEMDCYTALGAVHARWRAVPGRFKDYISQPKSNGYRSIHTTVMGRDAKRVEVQIRTREMHEVAEGGVAAHWSYKDGERVENRFANDAFSWFASLAERADTLEDHEEFVEHVKLEMFADQVFCFTPKGKVIKLPRGAVPLDFAYAIHTHLGDTYMDAKVNGRPAGLTTRLRNGQSVEIITDENQTPDPNWIDLVMTGKAKTAIRRALRIKIRRSYIERGREIARTAFATVRKSATKKALLAASKKYGFESEEPLLELLGIGKIEPEELVQRLYPEMRRRPEEETVKPGHAISGLEAEQGYRRASCCQPLPGEKIIGIVGKGNVVEAHATSCPKLPPAEDQSTSWIDLEWNKGLHGPVNTVTISLGLANNAGALGRICTLTGEQNANISNLTITRRGEDFFHLVIDIDVRDLEHFNNVITAVETDTDISYIYRSSDSENLQKLAQVQGIEQ